MSPSHTILTKNAGLRAPIPADISIIHALVRCCPPLEPNSGYAYLLMCTHFAQSSIVAFDHSGIAGFVFGYRVPERQRTLFIWQVAVHPSARGQGLGQAMLTALAAADIEFIEATVSPSNDASLRMFQKFAQNKSCPLVHGERFRSQLFPETDHGDEQLIRIGPLKNGHREEDRACL
jgi:L-2,4-diaminobutyric acid acetyltransferase